MKPHAGLRTRRSDLLGGNTAACSCGRTKPEDIIFLALRRARHQPVSTTCPHCGDELPRLPLSVFGRIGVSD